MLNSKYSMTRDIPSLFGTRYHRFSNVQKANDDEPEFANISIITGDG